MFFLFPSPPLFFLLQIGHTYSILLSFGLFIFVRTSCIHSLYYFTSFSLYVSVTHASRRMDYVMSFCYSYHSIVCLALDDIAHVLAFVNGYYTICLVFFLRTA
ncbi:hypothetical protein SCHPADRAFT_551672 [Schizopora paradoxa]|uniref:Uncharacterized protein n=1 Tax=Schizopora paradoxa TaxID=27342 RepID=A0A0H2RY78_9AGAM|nr:hypothetical protein SCHPADRAFT_551672 [Schizopora paradoxa]